ncbi:uncharacterized protein [Salminus brasiliensis]|uniref:uncharacterized protein n=1 Tax=Salminus brasiliensis TaxID=930266 RepID=UPI003B836242
MPATDTWPCSVSMNSASSCDSMVSTNSGFSDDSMEYLSAEERACLMFLEETIESLEAEDDSGVSNDEPDVLNYSPATKVAHLSPISQTKTEELSSYDDPNKVLGKDHKPNNSLFVPTPLVLANGKILKKADEASASERKVVPSNSHRPPASLPSADEPARSATNPATSEPTADRSNELPDLPPPFIPEPPVKAGSSIHLKTNDSPLKAQLDPRLVQKSKSASTNMLMELIPPPSDFMDKPDPSPPVPAQLPKQSQLQPQTQASAKPQTQPQTQAPAQEQVKPQTLTQTQAKPQMQPQALAQNQAKPQTQGQTQPQMQPQTQALAQNQVKPQTQGQAQPQMQPQNQAKPQTQGQAQPQMQPQNQAKPQTQGQAQTQAPAQNQAKPQTQALDKPQIQPQAQAKAQMQSSTQAQAQPQTQPQPQPQLPLQLQTQPPAEGMTIAPPPGFGGQAEGDKPQSTGTPSSRGPLSPSQLDVLRKKASLKKAPEKAPVAAVQPSSQKVSKQASFPVSCPEGHPATALEHSEPRSPPAVAPKPKKLPSTIVLKSLKDSGPGHSLVPPSDRVMNTQKVHIEALKKLGLLKADEPDSAPSLSSSAPERLPPPPAFNMSTYAAPSTGDGGQEMKHAEVEARGKMDAISSSPLIPRESPKPFEIKSASLERPRIGFKSVTADHSSLIMGPEKNNVELSPGQMRRSRPRPASAGSRKEMGIDQLPSDSGQNKDVRRSLGSSPIPPPVQPSTDSQVPPRSHGMISVVFTPHSKNGEERKQALRRLGLIRD